MFLEASMDLARDFSLTMRGKERKGEVRGGGEREEERRRDDEPSEWSIP